MFNLYDLITGYIYTPVNDLDDFLLRFVVAVFGLFLPIAILKIMNDIGNLF